MGIRVETLVGDEYKDGHFHDASEHGLAWASLNELLHVIVFIFTLYGMFQFRVKFIRMIELVKWLSRLIIAHSFYLSFKFALIASITYAYNTQLELHGIEMSSFNCSLANFERILERATSSNYTNETAAGDLLNEHKPNRSLENNLSDLLGSANYLLLLNAILDHYGGPFKLLGHLATLMYGFYAIAIFIMLAIFPLELMLFIDVGFNYIRFVLSDPGCMRDLYERRAKHLARLSSWSRNQASSLHTQGAKMILNQRQLRSNHEHTKQAIATLDARLFQCNHLEQAQFQSPPIATHQSTAKRASAAAVARFKHTQLALRGAMSMRVRPSSRAHKISAKQWNQHEPPVMYKFNQHSNLLSGINWIDSNHSSSHKFFENATTSLTASQQFFKYFTETHHQATIFGNQAEDRRQSHNVNAIKQLRSRLAINHHDRPSYAVCIANKNLEKFKPFVRSDVWFKASMIIYPIFIFFYFIMLIFHLGSIEYYFELALNNIESACNEQLKVAKSDQDQQQGREWSHVDYLMYYENIYTVFAISCASSFYCSYYFGTIIELSIWMREIRQQIELCVHIILLDDILSHPSEFNGLQMLRLMRHQHQREQSNLGQSILGCSQSSSSSINLNDEVGKHVNDFGGFNLFYAEPLDRTRQSLISLKHLMGALIRVQLRRALQSIKQLTHLMSGSNRSSTSGYAGAKLRELMALRLLSKRETVMRATYVNMCLFFDELNETRFMNTTILRRTTQIASGFAFMASITRSQFQANHLTYLLLITLVVFNFYLACAAYINSNVNKMLVQIHSLISASLKSGCENADLFEFWLRHVSSFGEDEDANAYLIYGYKVTWSTILNIDSVIFTVYFMTT